MSILSSSRDPGPDADPRMFPPPPPLIRYDQGELDKLVAFHSKILNLNFSQSLAYNQVIIAAGYAGSFALWSVVKADLDSFASNTIVLFLGTSLCTFISWLVFTMIWNATERLRAVEWTAGKKGEEFVAAHQAAQEASEFRFQNHFRVIWIWVLIVTIATAAIAMVILLVHVALNLLTV